MNYTLNQLQVFLKVAQTQSVTKAAEELHLTQPAVSIQLRNLQLQFDIPLTEVVGRKIHITDFGKELALAAENILNQVYAINYKTQAFKGKLTGKLKIAIVSTGIYVMPYFLSDFMENNEAVELQMDVTNKSGVLRSLEENEVDYALVSVLPKTLNIDRLDLLQNKLYLVGGAKSGYEDKTHDQSLLKSIPIIFREKGSGTRQTMQDFMDQNDVSVLKKMELTSNEAVKQAVIAGMGYSIMPLIGIKNELMNKDLHVISVKGLPISSTWRLIWLKGKNHSPAATHFLKYLKEEKESIIKNKFAWYEDY